MHHKLIKILFYLYVLLVIISVFWSVNTTGGERSLNKIYVLNLRADYLLHILAFLPWAFFGYLMNKNFWWWLLAGILFASLSESMHYFLDYRTYNINDLISNLIGIVLGAVIILFIKKIRTIR